jgi:hypothetical protein
MKTNLIIPGFLLVASMLVFTSCGKEGPAGKDGVDGLNADVFYSVWYTPTIWNGQTGDWYFDVSNSAINQDIVEGGVILAYVSLPGDIYPAAVRSLPAYALGCNWDYLVPDYGKIEFLCDAINEPGTANHFFRFILIPGNIPVKSSGHVKYSREELKKMSYLEVCKAYGIPE